MKNVNWHFPRSNHFYWGVLMNIIGENIRKLRKMSGLTQIEFAKQIGISQGTLSDIEQGNCNPSVDTVLSIHKRYEVTLDWLLKGTEKANASARPKTIDLSLNEIKLLELVKKLSEEDQEELIEYAEFKLKRKR